MALSLLVIDDSEIDRFMYRRLIRRLSAWKIAVDEADSFESAVAKYEQKKYDAVMCDFRMPGCDGTQIIRSMRASELNADTPVVLATGYQSPEFYDEAKAAGAKHVITKDELDTPRLQALLRDMIPNIDTRAA